MSRCKHAPQGLLPAEHGGVLSSTAPAPGIEAAPAGGLGKEVGAQQHQALHPSTGLTENISSWLALSHFIGVPSEQMDDYSAAAKHEDFLFFHWMPVMQSLPDYLCNA